MIENLISESTECDFKEAVEKRKPKSWLKSVSAFANGIGGTLLFGVDNDGNVIGLDDPQGDSEVISDFIKTRIHPVPQYILTPEKENNKTVLKLIVKSGRNTPYYYRGDGSLIAFIRNGNESIEAPYYVVSELILKGENRSYDSLVTDKKKSDYSFTFLEANYLDRTGLKFESSNYVSFGLATPDGFLTNAGCLMTDQYIVLNSRLFCTRWNGLDKGSIFDDALDDKEYEGNLVSLLKNGCEFIRNNSKVRFEKKAQYRIDKPDYADRAVTEALVNALIHRDYLVLGSEVHIDMFDDRVEIYSPGGMYKGDNIQDQDINEVGSVRRNPIIADLFHRMRFMERRGSGLKKILSETANLPGYNEKLRPEFRSTSSNFIVILKNVNYSSWSVSDQDSDQDSDYEKIAKEILLFCEQPKGKKEICEHLGYTNLTYFSRHYLKPLIADGRLKMTLPDKPKSKNQKYVKSK